MIKPGLSNSITLTVDATNVASAVGSGLLPVFATPYMIGEMENAASNLLSTLTKEGEASVGTKVHIEHLLASPIGTVVTTTATITEVDRRRVEFEVVSTTPAGVIGRGTHTRFIVDIAPFMKKVEAQRD